MDGVLDSQRSDFSLVNAMAKVTTQHYFYVSIKLRYSGYLQPHQRLALVGETYELGCWAEPKVFLNQISPGEFELEKLLVTQKCCFRGKFAVIDPHSSLQINFERGVDRIFDLELLPALPLDGIFDTQNMTQDDNVVIKKVELELEWEIFSVKFSVSHPLGNEHG